MLLNASKLIIFCCLFLFMTGFGGPPGLRGTVFSDLEKENAREKNSLLFVSLMTDCVCNLACPDCYVGVVS